MKTDLSRRKREQFDGMVVSKEDVSGLLKIECICWPRERCYVERERIKGGEVFEDRHLGHGNRCTAGLCNVAKE